MAADKSKTQNGWTKQYANLLCDAPDTGKPSNLLTSNETVIGLSIQVRKQLLFTQSCSEVKIVSVRGNQTAPHPLTFIF